MSRNLEFASVFTPNIRCMPYCICEFPNSVFLADYKGYIPDLIKCRCGEEDAPGLCWRWYSNNDSDTLVSDRDITFHPTYSQGTAIVRGGTALYAGMVHFWEMRIITALSGTDIMFGIGTDKVDLNQYKFHFGSALGLNPESWGFSYNGILQHNGAQKEYGQGISQGCIVGIYLDRIRGQMKIFLNRRSLGVAFTNIPINPNIILYPMVSSTAAKSVVRLISATSELDCLELRAFEMLSKQPKAIKVLQNIPGFQSTLKKYWFLNLHARYSREPSCTDSDIADLAVLPSRIIMKNQKYQDEEADIIDIYSNINKIAPPRDNADDDRYINDYFDEYFHYLL